MKIGKNAVSLKLPGDFRRLYRRGKSVAGGYTVVYAMPNKRDFNRVGLTVSTSVGKAVVRSRTKRLIRESYRQIEASIPTGYDFVIVARSRAANKEQQQIRRDIEFCMRSLGLTE